MAHRGGLFISVAALIFFSYSFNVGGLQTRLDSFFRQLDLSTRSHNTDVARGVTSALPYVTLGIGFVAFLFLLSVIAHFGRSGTKRGRQSASPRRETVKRPPTAASVASPTTGAASPAVHAPPRPPRLPLGDAILIKPARLPGKESDFGPPATVKAAGAR